MPNKTIPTSSIDPKAKKILFNTFWKNGWIDDGLKAILPADFEYAKSCGIMFDPLSISHDELINRVVGLTNGMPAGKAAQAFLCSFSTRRLDWRSGLASWHHAKSIPLHQYAEQKRITGHFYENGVAIPCERCECSICGGSKSYTDEELNVLNFERLRWGGVRHGNLIYTLLDLEQLARETIPEPSEQDIAIFHEILKTIETSAPNDPPGTLRNRLKGVLPSNKDELGTLLEILACCDVLEVTSTDRRDPGGHHDWSYVTYWRGEDSYSKAAVDKLFGRFF